VTLGIGIVSAEGHKWSCRSCRGWCPPIANAALVRPSAGNRNKLTIALALIRRWVRLPTSPSGAVRRLVHARPAGHAIAASWIPGHRPGPSQYRPVATPPPRSGRGRPHKYGDQLTRERIDALPAITLELCLYGKAQTVRLRSIVAMARFLQGTPVRAMWCEFFDPDKNTWSSPACCSPRTPACRRNRAAPLRRRWASNAVPQPLKYQHKKRWP